jgi:hypothetical protein
MAHLAKTHGDPCTAECRRNVFSNGRSDEDLLGVKDLLDEVISALGVEFGKQSNFCFEIFNHRFKNNITLLKVFELSSC